MKLPSNQFGQKMEEQKDDSMFLGHRNMWGDGPRIPLRAKIWIRTANDGGVHATETAKALGEADFLWDWESEDEIAKLNALYTVDKVKDFLRNSLDYKRNDNTGPPGSTNCHVDHGGKRGATATVFPAPAAPFPVARCTARVWASASKAALVGADAGWTGATFQPSRMARDTYKVSVYLASEKGASGAALDVVGTAADLRRDNPDLPFAESGWFEIKRIVRARYIRKSPAVEAANLTMSTTEYARAGLILDWVPGPADETTFQASYNTYVDRILQNQLHNEANVAQVNFKKPAADLVRAVADAFEGIDQFTGNSAAGVAPAFTAHAYPAFVDRVKVKVIRQYVCDKPRKYNTPKKKYDIWRNSNPLPADDTPWLLAFYGRLSAKRKKKIDDTLQQHLAQNLVDDDAKYRNRVGNAAMQGFKVIGGQYLHATTEDGFICFHCADSVQFRTATGAFVEEPTSVGGLAPSDSTTSDRKKAINLMYLLQTVPANRVNVPNVYDVSVSPIIKHEIGHNFYLVHAPAAPDAPREAGGFKPAFHDAADMRCLMNYDMRSDHLCGLCNLRLRGWAALSASGAGFVNLSNASAANKKP